MASIGPMNVVQGVTRQAEWEIARQRNDLQQEDYVAGRNVSVILLSIITAAMVAGMAAVVWIVLAAW